MCSDHLKKTEILPHIHKTQPQKVCDNCHAGIKRQPATTATSAPAAAAGTTTTLASSNSFVTTKTTVNPVATYTNNPVTAIPSATNTELEECAAVVQNAAVLPSKLKSSNNNSWVQQDQSSAASAARSGSIALILANSNNSDSVTPSKLQKMNSWIKPKSSGDGDAARENKTTITASSGSSGIVRSRAAPPAPPGDKTINNTSWTVSPIAKAQADGAAARGRPTTTSISPPPNREAVMSLATRYTPVKTTTGNQTIFDYLYLI